MNTTPHIISDTATLRQALARLNELSGKAMTLFVVDASGRLAGTLTDGDVRRALLGDAALDDSVCLAMPSVYNVTVFIGRNSFLLRVWPEGLSPFPVSGSALFA